jgi:hypothetical protein
MNAIQGEAQKLSGILVVVLSIASSGMGPASAPIQA